MTFALGLASVYCFQNIKLVENKEIQNAAIVTIAPKQARFIEGERQHSLVGYDQYYITDDGFQLKAVYPCIFDLKKREVIKKIISKDDKKIISEVRIRTTKYFEIYQSKLSRCIHSPTIELGLELEEHLNKNHK